MPTDIPAYTLPQQNRQVLLQRRPNGVPQAGDFELATSAMPNLSEGTALVRNVYLSVARGSGPDAAAVVLRVNPQGEITEFPLDEVKFMQAEIPNAPRSEETRRGDPRMSTVTDLAFADGRIFIAGLSNEEFASKLRSIPPPWNRSS